MRSCDVHGPFANLGAKEHTPGLATDSKSNTLQYVSLGECGSEVSHERTAFPKITSTTNQFLMKLCTNSFGRRKWLISFLISVLPPPMNFVIDSNQHPTFFITGPQVLLSLHLLCMAQDILSTNKIWSELSHDKSRDVSHSGIMILFMPR